MQPAVPRLLLRQGRVGELDVLRDIDEESAPMFLASGVDLSHLGPEHPFVRSEADRWRAGLRAGRVQVAEIEGEVVAFSMLDSLDGKPYLDQLSVRTSFMRRGIGSMLLARAQRESELEGSLSLTTYAQVPWNGPYYARAGFRVASDADCGPEIRAVLATQRTVMPLPEARVAMVCLLP